MDYFFTREEKMNSQYSDFSQVVRESACSMLNDPGVLSDSFIAEALKRGRGKAINLQDAKELVRDYLSLLCEKR